MKHYKQTIKQIIKEHDIKIGYGLFCAIHGMHSDIYIHYTDAKEVKKKLRKEKKRDYIIVPILFENKKSP